MEMFSDERPIERTAVNIHEVLDHVRRLAASGFARHIAFTESYDPSLPPVLGNRDLLVQALLNLVKNAAESAPAGEGTIELSTSFHQGLRLTLPGSGSRVELPLAVGVRDNGPGVPDDLGAHLFDPFVSHQERRPRPGARPGGQGGGRPRRPDRVREPDEGHAVPAHAAGGARGGPGERGMSEATVLIADDDRAIRTVLLRALGGQGYRVRSTGTASTLWQWVSSGEGDLVITDVVLPDGNGLDLIPRIKKLRPGPAHHRDERSEHAPDSGQGDRARGLRVPAQALRPARAGCGRGAGPLGAAPGAGRCRRRGGAGESACP